MRVIAKCTLRLFWEQAGCGDAERPLTEWHALMQKACWPTPQALKADLRTVSILKGRRAVFNIGGNKYRVIVDIDYARQAAWIRFVGSHAQYDQIDAESV